MNRFRRIMSRSGVLGLPFVLMAAAARYGARQLRTLVIRHVLGLKTGARPFLGSGLRFANISKIRLGDDVTVRNDARFWSELDSGTLRIEDGAEIGAGACVDFSGGLVIGERVLISEGVLVYTHDHGHDPRSVPTATPLEIGKDAWIAARAIILPSVNRIGAGAIVGAGAVLTEDLEDGAIFVGARGRVVSGRREMRSAAE